jgi:hypothetical protein
VVTRHAQAIALCVLLSAGIVSAILPTGTGYSAALLSESLQLQFSTYLGGDGIDYINAIVTDDNGDIYITG